MTGLILVPVLAALSAWNVVLYSDTGHGLNLFAAVFSGFTALFIAVSEGTR